MSFSFYFSFVKNFKEELQFFCTSQKDFTRRRKLELDDLVGFILSLVANRNSNGYEISSQKYFEKKASQLEKRTSGGIPNRSAISQSRNKLHWEAFRYLLDRLNDQSQGLSAQMKWHDHHVYAVDGSWIDLPYREEFINQFPSPRAKANSGHYPKGKLIVAHSVLTGIPKAACLGEENYSERSGLFELIPQLEKDSVLLLDRGYEGLAVMKRLQDNGMKFIVRQRTGGGGERLEVGEFLRSGKKDAIVLFKNGGEELLVRLLKVGADRQGRPMVLAVNLLDQKKFPRKAIRELYFKRWKIETLYYQMKRLLNLENFHARNMNGVFQEIWASLLYVGLTAVNLVQCQLRLAKTSLKRLNFKNAVELINERLLFLIYSTPTGNFRNCFNECLERALMRSYHFYQPRRKNPRICKRSHINWTGGRKNKSIDRYKAKIKKTNNLNA